MKQCSLCRVKPRRRSLSKVCSCFLFIKLKVIFMEIVYVENLLASY